MIEVTDEMVDAAMRYFNNPENAKQNDRDWIAGVIKIIIELHEANKPKPEPVAYKVCNPAGCVLVESRKSAEKLSSEYGNGTYQPLYTTPLTREPLSEDFLLRLADECTTQFFNGVRQNATVHFARAIEKAHRIGVNHD